eukprot:1793612-Pyramimonas_sp.AAC.1
MNEINKKGFVLVPKYLLNLPYTMPYSSRAVSVACVVPTIVSSCCRQVAPAHWRVTTTALTNAPPLVELRKM